MTSYLIDKLEALKEDENKLKEEQRVLEEKIELEIEKNRRLELDGTIIKLRTQVGELAKNIEGKILPDNRNLVLNYGKHNYTQEEQREILGERKPGTRPPFLTLEKFKDNVSKIDEWMNNGSSMDQRRQVRQYCEIPHTIKIYDDIIPIFTTMIGIMKKQEFEIDALKSKLEILIVFRDKF